jgi:tetratricopeptide (TPR) repeat protein
MTAIVSRVALRTSAVSLVSNRAMRCRHIFALLLTASFGCAPRPVPAVAPRIAPEVLAARLAEADHLASRGCYLCLKEAAAAYASLLADSDDLGVARKAVENDLMVVAREIELRIPDSGARDAAEQLRLKVPLAYDAYFAALELMAAPIVGGGVTLQNFRAVREERLKLVAELEKDLSASAMKGYFFIALALQLREFKEVKPTVDAVLAVHPDDLSLKYRMLAFQPTYSAEGARDLIGQETGFGEVHLLMGQRALLNGNLPGAFRELTRARQLLPDSVSINFALANVTFSYARYADALALYDSILASPAATGLEAPLKLGRAKSLSYLKRHDEAIALLTDVLQNDPSNNPGEKYYWRGWNYLQMGQAQPAHDDAREGLNAMRNDAIYRLAGMASFSLDRIGESRKFFEEALMMNRADCDSERYLGLLDSAEGGWKPASSRFSVAASCYEAVITRMRVELAEYEKDITGLSNGLIGAKRIEIRETQALRDQSILNAAAATRNIR